jgi:hypothetical protein
LAGQRVDSWKVLKTGGIQVALCCHPDFSGGRGRSSALGTSAKMKRRAGLWWRGAGRAQAGQTNPSKRVCAEGKAVRLETWGWRQEPRGVDSGTPGCRGGKTRVRAEGREGEPGSGSFGADVQALETAEVRTDGTEDNGDAAWRGTGNRFAEWIGLAAPRWGSGPQGCGVRRGGRPGAGRGRRCRLDGLAVAAPSEREALAQPEERRGGGGCKGGAVRQRDARDG